MRVLHASVSSDSGPRRLDESARANVCAQHAKQVRTAAEPHSTLRGHNYIDRKDQAERNPSNDAQVIHDGTRPI